MITEHPEEGDWDLIGSVGRVQAWGRPGMGTDRGAIARLTAIRH